MKKLLLVAVAATLTSLTRARPIPPPAAPDKTDRSHHSQSVCVLKYRTLTSRARNIRIPKIDFRQAELVDVLAYLRRQSIEADPESDPAKKKGIDFLVAPCLQSPDKALPKVTMAMHNVSLLDVVLHLSDLLEIPIYTKSNAFVIGKKDTRLIARLYDIKPQALTAMVKGMPDVPERERAARYFAGMGVKFPSGASIRTLPHIGKLVAVNTESNLELFEKLLEVLDVVTSMVEIDARLLEIRDTTILKPDTVLDIPAEDKFIASGQMNMLLELSTIAESAANTMVEVKPRAGKGTSQTPAATFKLRPQVSPEGQLILLEIDGRVSIGGEDAVDYRLKTQATLYNGCCALFWLDTRKGKSLTHRYLRITVWLVDPAGRPILSHHGQSIRDALLGEMKASE